MLSAREESPYFVLKARAEMPRFFAVAQNDSNRGLGGNLVWTGRDAAR